MMKKDKGGDNEGHKMKMLKNEGYGNTTEGDSKRKETSLSVGIRLH